MPVVELMWRSKWAHTVRTRKPFFGRVVLQRLRLSNIILSYNRVLFLIIEFLIQNKQ